MRTGLLAASALLVWAAASSCRADVRYRVVDIGMVGSYETRAVDINNRGQVVGFAVIPSYGLCYGFIWENGVRMPLSTLGGTASVPYAINGAGNIAGYSTRTGYMPELACVWENGVVREIADLGGQNSVGHDINANGDVAGYSQLSSGGHAMLVQGTTARDLGSLGGPVSYANGINDSGHVVGYANYTSGGGVSHAFLWRDGEMADLGTLGGPGSNANSLDSRDRVVGQAYVDSVHRHAFCWENGVMTDLGHLGSGYSIANDINERGQIVGNSGSYPDLRACVWEGGAIADLNSLIPSDSGWLLNSASAINDLGQIVGTGKVGGLSHAYLLDPIPEPSCLLALLCGLGGLICRRRR